MGQRPRTGTSSLANPRAIGVKPRLRPGRLAMGLPVAR
jgi:hypothetical protein